jgi:hypothetical protein
MRKIFTIAFSVLLFVVVSYSQNITLGGPPATSSTTTVYNIDDQNIGTWPPTGWKTVCILPTCNPGGTVPPTSTTWTIDNPTPSLDGDSMLLGLTSPSGMASTDNAEVLVTYIAGTDETATNFSLTYHIYPNANASSSNALEVDQFSFNVTYNTEFMFAHECVFGHFWQVWNGVTANWVNTTIPCSGTTGLPTGQWTSITYNDHRVAGDTNSCSGHPCMYFDNMIINGTTYPINMVEPSQTLPLGWASGVGMQLQIDIPYNSGVSKTVDVNYDEISFSHGVNITGVSTITFGNFHSGSTLTIGLSGGGSTSGPPNYPLSRIDRNITSALLPPNYPCPPNASTSGSPCNSGVQGQGLVNTGWLYGDNVVITDPNYNNVQYVRVADYSDTIAPYFCTGPEIGPGGSAEENVFEMNDNYFVLDCGTSGGIRIKTFNPTTLQSSGYVSGWNGTGVNCGTPNYCMAGQGEFDYTHPNTFHMFTSNIITKWTLAGSIATQGAEEADLSYGIPCWQQTNQSPACGDWVSGTYAAGTNILPVTGNSGDSNGPHSFQLANWTCTGGTSPNCAGGTFNNPTYPCTTGGTYPTWGSSSSSELTLIVDGTCLWVDLGPVDNYTHSYTGLVSPDGMKFSAGTANFQGDGGKGSIFAVYYNSTILVYDHLTTATGNSYSFTCGGGGIGPTCAGGTRTMTFVGNVMPAANVALNTPCTPPAENCQDAILLHNIKMAKDGVHVTVGAQTCAFKSPSMQCPTAGGGYISFWLPGSASPIVSMCADDGHHASGFSHIASLLGYATANPYHYSFGTPYAQGSTCPITTPVLYWDVFTTPPSQGSCFVSGVFICPTEAPFDYHNSWTYANSTDTTPSCAATYADNYGINGWPFQYPYQGEIVCFATDGTNRVWRQAFIYDTYSSKTFNTAETIGSMSSDGKFWGNSSDYWCTLGNINGGTTSLCGFNWQASNTYNLNDIISPGTNNGPAAGSSVFQAVSCGGACTTSSSAPAWPSALNATVVDGNVTWKNIGTNNALGGVFIYKLQ